MYNFKQRLHDKKPLVGTLLSMGLPVVAEVVSRCGFDWLWIDMEHAPLSLEQTQQLIQSGNRDCAKLVRLPANDEVWIKQILDLGADGIIVPQVKNALEAQKAVSAAKYPPEGNRSVGIARAHGFGMEFADYVARANAETLVFVQVEHVDGVNKYR